VKARRKGERFVNFAGFDGDERKKEWVQISMQCQPGEER